MLYMLHPGVVLGFQNYFLNKQVGAKPLNQKAATVKRKLCLYTLTLHTQCTVQVHQRYMSVGQCTVGRVYVQAPYTDVQYGQKSKKGRKE